LPAYFRQLLEYRLKLKPALAFNNGTGEASGLYLLAYRQVDEMNSRIRRSLQDLDQPLAELISPEGRTFTKPELVERFGYPDVDIGLLDADEW
jgi:hypothetical protein